MVAVSRSGAPGGAVARVGIGQGQSLGAALLNLNTVSYVVGRGGPKHRAPGEVA